MNLRRTIWILNAALLAVLGYVVAGVVFDRRPEEPAETHSAAVARPTPAEDPLPAMAKKDYAVIAERNIFGSGRPRKTTVVRAAKAKPLQAGKELRLCLLGTIAGDADFARAVIKDTTNKSQDLYKIGDVIQEARIERIERNRVLLLRDGRREVLELQVTSQPASGRAKPGSPKPAAKQIRPEDVIETLSPSEFRVNRKAFMARVGGMQAILKRTKMTPYMVDGKMQGLRVTGIKKVGMARLVGLEEGDVIQALNGQKLNSRHRARQIFKKAPSLRSLHFDLLRGSKKKRLSFRME